MIVADVLGLEERAMNAWPARQTLAVGGWALRIAGGYTKRANSANALAPRGNFADVKAAAEALYTSHNLPAIFRLSPLAPPTCDAILEAQGYRLSDPSLIMTAPIAACLADTAIRDRVELASRPSREWLDGSAATNAVSAELRPTHDEIVQSIALPAIVATLREGDVPLGFGLAVSERGMVGLFDIVIAPAARGRGLGGALTQALLGWGAAIGATAAYLQVRRSNTAAIGLYRRLGFTEAYSYHYRIAPD